MRKKVLYTADMHGNETQYKKLVRYAIDVWADFVIIGGDIAPKGLSSDLYIKTQRKFLRETLPELLRPLKKELPSCRVFLMLGNDDCSANLDVLTGTDPDIFQVIHKKRIRLTDDFDIVGYSYVPITPFGIKDWEKFDLSRIPVRSKNEYLRRKESNYRLNGFKSTKEGWEEFAFSPDMEAEDSIQKDLEDDRFTRDAKKTVCVIHTPPNRTNLDQVGKGVHVGSLAVREFIERHQPYLTLHGHIHETVSVTGEFKDKIGSTMSLSAGNHNAGPELAVLIFDLYDPTGVQRKII